MKNWITVMILFFSISFYAQKVSFDTAKSYYDTANFVKAKAQINALLIQEKVAKNEGRVWYLRTDIYAALLREGSLEINRNELINEIGKSIQKTKTLVGEKSSYYKLISEKQQALWVAEVNIAVNHFNKQQYEKAYEYYKTSLTLKPNHPETMVYLAYTAKKLAAYEEAISLYERLIEQNKVDDITYAHYISCYEAKKIPIDQLIILLDMGLETFPKSKILQGKKIKMLSNEQQYDTLASYLETLVEENPKDPSYILQQAINFEAIYKNNLERGNSLTANDFYLKARNNYLKVVANEDPKVRFVANYNMASILSYKASEYQQIASEMDDGTSIVNSHEIRERSHSTTREAIQYMLVAHEINPKEVAILSALKQFYTTLGDSQKVQEFTEKLNTIRTKN
jgi:tetratricopeptide (TPR) repeat protein